MNNINTNYDAWRDKMQLSFGVGILSLIAAIIIPFLTDEIYPAVNAVLYIVGGLGLFVGFFCLAMSYVSDIRFYLEKLYELKSKENENK